MADDQKPRYRVSAGSSRFTSDSFQNFAANLGYGTSNIGSNATYGFNPVSRNHQLLEWAYRGSWIVKQVVDAIADDMTREGIEVESDMPPDEIDELHEYLDGKLFWNRINETIKWSRLYGGCLAVILIDGQKPETPLRIDTIGKDQFIGLKVMDRWTVWPHLEDPITDFADPDFGYPKFYESVTDAKMIPHMRIHHSRVLRLDGIELPYWQKIAENMWGLSVLEPLWDRLQAFDSTSQGAAQLVYRAHLRTLKIEKLRELIAFGGEAYQGVLKQIEMIRLMQSNEALTVLDSTDEFDTHQYAFGGLSDVLIQFAQQLSGAAQIPLTRLFGQSPAGMNATGESDLRNYYDAINAQQEARLRQFIKKILDIAYRSLTGKELPKGFNFHFAPLWQLDSIEKSTVAMNITTAVTKAVEDAIITPAIALKELRQSSKVTGVYSNITDEDIQTAEEAPPPMLDPSMVGQGPGGPQAGLGQALGQQQPAKPKAAQQASKTQEKDDDEEPADRDKLPPTTREHVAKMFQKDTLPPLRDVHGIQVTIETPKGNRRMGPGWQVQMPCDYGYINGTFSPEGPLEQFDCFVGPDEDSTAVWLIEQQHPDTKEFDEYKAMLLFGDRDEAINTYKSAFADGRADDRIASVKRMNISAFRDFITEWGMAA